MPIRCGGSERETLSSHIDRDFFTSLVVHEEQPSTLAEPQRIELLPRYLKSRQQETFKLGQRWPTFVRLEDPAMDVRSPPTTRFHRKSRKEQNLFVDLDR